MARPGETGASGDGSWFIGCAGRPGLADAWATPIGALGDRQRRELLEFFLATAHAPSKRLAEELHALRREESRLVNPVPEAMVMRELPRPRPAFLLRRGALAQKRQAEGRP